MPLLALLFPSPPFFLIEEASIKYMVCIRMHHSPLRTKRAWRTGMSVCHFSTINVLELCELTLAHSDTRVLWRKRAHKTRSTRTELLVGAVQGVPQVQGCRAGLARFIQTRCFFCHLITSVNHLCIVPLSKNPNCNFSAIITLFLKTLVLTP